VKKIAIFFILLILTAVCIAGCGSSVSGLTNEVDLDNSSFAQSSITIQKGQSITLVNQTDTTHVIANGQWDFNTPDPLQETGAPFANNVTLNSANQTEIIGPFNTAGTFHFYCTIHPDMNLVVTVQ
jgi:plastocyanin